MLSDRGLCDELITRLEEFHRMWCVVVCNLENLKNEEAMIRVRSQRKKEKNKCVKLIPRLKMCAAVAQFVRPYVLVVCFLLVLTFLAPEFYV